MPETLAPQQAPLDVAEAAQAIRSPEDQAVLDGVSQALREASDRIFDPTNYRDNHGVEAVQLDTVRSEGGTGGVSYDGQGSEIPDGEINHADINPRDGNGYFQVKEGSSWFVTQFDAKTGEKTVTESVWEDDKGKRVVGTKTTKDVGAVKDAAEKATMALVGAAEKNGVRHDLPYPGTRF